MKNKIGFWGYPNPEISKQIIKEYPDVEWLDLDIDFGYADRHILPESYCKIIKNILNNAIELKDELIKIVAPIGKDKCDSGWFVAKVLKDLGFDVVESIFEEIDNKKNPLISTSNMPLFDKVNVIMGNIAKFPEGCDEGVGLGDYVQCEAKFGFWGVPPNDLEILKLFPDETHVYGWTRCTEMGVSADIETEMYVNSSVPTVFYAQAFCAKCQLAKYLADKYNGLYVDIDDVANNSIKTKIEAFLRLR